MTFTGYQLHETPGARLLLPLTGGSGDQFWVSKQAITGEKIEVNPFGKRSPITCEIADWWWEREQQQRAKRSNKTRRAARPKLKQAEMFR